MDMAPYRDLFISEATEHVRSLTELVVALEKAPDEETVNALFRHAHSVKGMAASMDYRTITHLAHMMENLLDRVRKKEFALGSAGADLLLAGGDLLEEMIADVAAGGSGEREVADLAARIDAFRGENAPVPADPPAADAPVEEEAGAAAAHRKIPTVRVRTELLDRLITVTGELLTSRHRIAAIGKDNGYDRLEEATNELSRLLRELHDNVLKVRMMPFSHLAENLPRLVRDLARRSGKKIDFTLQGTEIEMDRGVLEELGDPLLHLIRNAVDHGIESPAERVAAGKPEGGTIVLSAAREGDDVMVTVADDGRGIDADRMVDAAVRSGFVSEEARSQLSRREALMLACLPGFSTAAEVTEISGRGVGMDAVQATMKNFGGILDIDSHPGEGTSMTLRFPRSVAIVNVLLVSAGGVLAAIPVSRIRKMLEIRSGFDLGGIGEEDLHLVSLAKLLGGEERRDRQFLPVVVADIQGRKTGLVAEEVLGQQEVFVRPLGRPLSAVRGLAGGALLGEGKPVFVLDVGNLQ